MANIGLNGATLNQVVAVDHINIQKYEQVGTGGGECLARDEFGNCLYYAPTYPLEEWVDAKTDAKVDGTVKATVNKVFIQGKNAILNGDKTEEKDTYVLESNERYVSGQHTNAQGTVTTGNSRNVFIGGKQVSTQPITVNTHVSGLTTTVKDGWATKVFIG